MSNVETPIKKEQSNGSSSENQKGIDNHKKAATHFEAAAKSHREAAKHHEDGNHEKADKSTVTAEEQKKLAWEAHKEVVKQPSLKN